MRRLLDYFSGTLILEYLNLNLYFYESISQELETQSNSDENKFFEINRCVLFTMNYPHFLFKSSKTKVFMLGRLVVIKSVCNDISKITLCPEYELFLCLMW